MDLWIGLLIQPTPDVQKKKVTPLLLVLHLDDEFIHK